MNAAAASATAPMPCQAAIRCHQRGAAGAARVGARCGAASRARSGVVAGTACSASTERDSRCHNAAGGATGDGVVFYRANPAFWLADFVPARYLAVIE